MLSLSLCILVLLVMFVLDGLLMSLIFSCLLVLMFMGLGIVMLMVLSWLSFGGMSMLMKGMGKEMFWGFMFFCLMGSGMNWSSLIWFSMSECFFMFKFLSSSSSCWILFLVSIYLVVLVDFVFVVDCNVN